MSLRLFEGPAGSGKTTRLVAHVNAAESYGELLLLRDVSSSDDRLYRLGVLDAGGPEVPHRAPPITLIPATLVRALPRGERRA